MRLERILTRFEPRSKSEIQGCISSNRVSLDLISWLRLQEQPGWLFLDDN